MLCFEYLIRDDDTNVIYFNGVSPVNAMQNK